MVDVHKRKDLEREFINATRGESAKKTIGKLYKGCEIFGLTKGQFSLSDLIKAILDQTGPVKLQISTWTAAKADIKSAYNLLKSGNIQSVRFLVDQSFKTRQPEYCKFLLEMFGSDAVRMTRSHCKFVLIRNEEWNITVRTSMNLNKNPRLENFEVSDDPKLCDFMQSLIDEVWTKESIFTEEDFKSLGLKNSVIKPKEVDDFDIGKEMEEAVKLV